MKVIQQGGSFLYFSFFISVYCFISIQPKYVVSSQLRSYCLVIVGTQDNGSRLCLEVFGILDHILVRKYSMPDTDYFLFVCLIMHVFWEQHCPRMHGISTPLKQKSYFLINMQISGFQ